jgi:SAM-dependent methyltransferase
MSRCPICDARLFIGLRPWHLVCKACGHEGSTLDAHILNQAPGGDLDEVAREDALETLRRSNFQRLMAIINRLTSKTPARQRPLCLLDVGCAHGWFLEQARGNYDASGIEPDRDVAKAAVARGLHVREGFFPDVLDTEERYDVIVFNDVLEHIPDINATLQACMHHLVPGGLLVINAPNRLGTLYRISKNLLRLGRSGTFDRMWQLGFPSPHVHYLDTNSIMPLAERHGFTLLASERLPSVSISGLYSRVRYSKDVSPLKASLLTLAVATAIPALRVLPPDIKAWFLSRKQDV